MTQDNTPQRDENLPKDSETLQEPADTPQDAPEQATFDSETLVGEDGTETTPSDVKPSERISEQYFDDDEEYLEEVSNDTELFASQDLGIYKQEDLTVSCEIQNLRTDSGKLRNKFLLRNDPPILRVTSSDGEYAEFVLTREFAKRLESDMESVHKAYYGIDTALESVTLKEKFARMWEWVQDHPVLSGIIVVLLVFFMLAMIF